MAESDHYWAVRVNDRGDSHPNYLGPMTYERATELAERLHVARRSFEMGPLLNESELPGLWLEGAD